MNTNKKQENVQGVHGCKKMIVLVGSTNKKFEHVIIIITFHP
jgi:hypothetical protein